MTFTIYYYYFYATLDFYSESTVTSELTTEYTVLSCQASAEYYASVTLSSEAERIVATSSDAAERSSSALARSVSAVQATATTEESQTARATGGSSSDSAPVTASSEAGGSSLMVDKILGILLFMLSF
jgi:hypothetical protein